MLHKLVASHGYDAVWGKGLEALSFPPTWALSGTEALAVINRFAKQ